MPKPAGALKIDRSKKTLRELTLEKMRAAILDEYFKAGERLVERTLCEELGVSRTIVREVLRHLETEGLVESVPNQGPVVASIDIDTTRQIYTLRALLEGHAAASCARLADAQVVARLGATVMLIEAAFAKGDLATVLVETGHFYEVMFTSGGESVAWGIVQSLNARINRLRAITIATPGRGETAIAEMRALLEAIRTQDATAAERAAQAHVHSVAGIALAALQGSGDTH